ncbi:hypothetical protein [Salicibibacter halophilus]|uniref:hypothetical protein n=1 Tax=Salicibibacter halophilus TaxID=2502791 RepID=UPI001359F612|nr:hypothetical protein [Salicibibacter halophilus]
MKEKIPGVIDRIEEGYAVILIEGDEQEMFYSASELYEGPERGIWSRSLYTTNKFRL